MEFGENLPWENLVRGIRPAIKPAERLSKKNPVDFF